MKSLLSIFLLICQTSIAQLNSIWFEKVTDEAGYSIHGVQHILQDKDGFIWLSHSDGVTKFDGYNFKLYSRKELATALFENKSVSLVFEDKRQDVWIVTGSGALMKYQSDVDRFQTMNDTTRVIEGGAFCFVEDDEGNFWIGSAGSGLYFINIEKGIFKNYRTLKNDTTSINNDYVSSLVIDNKANIWIGTTNGLCSYDRNKDAFRRVKLVNSNVPDIYRYRVIRDLELSREGFLYVGTYGGLHKIDLETRNSHHFFHDPTNPTSLSHNSIFAVKEDHDGEVWIATYGGGLNRFSPLSNEFKSWRSKVNEIGSLHTNNLFTVYFDSHGRLWIGAADDGVFLYNPHAKKIRSVGNSPYDSASISAGWIRRVFQENDSIVWIGFNGSGLNKFNIKTEKVVARYVNDPRDTTSLAHNVVVAIDKDKYGNLWFGLEGGGLNKLSKGSEKFSRYVFKQKRNSISNNAVSAILVDDDFVWVATHVSGLDVFDIRKGKFYHFSEDSLKKIGITFSATDNIIKHDGNIWFATHQGVVVFDKTSRAFVKIPNTKGDIATLERNLQLELRPYTDKEVLINGDFSEVVKIRYNGPSSFQQEILWKDTVDHGDSYEMRFAADREGNLWVISGDQLSKIDLRRNDKSTFSVTNTLTKERRLTGVFMASDERIFLTGTNGFNWFYPSDIRRDSTPVNVVLTGLEIFNKPVTIQGLDSIKSDEFHLSKHLDNLEQLKLHYYQNFFSIRFAALTFAERDKIQYAYQLEGFDKDWVNIGTRRFASYTNLDPGTYSFKVKATNADGYWNSEAKSIEIVILPPFWRTSWFIALAIFAAGAVIYSVHRYRVAQTLRVERLRNKIASDLHDEVGSSLTRISIYSDLLQTGVEAEDRKNYLAGIGTLSRDVVSTMSDIVWSIDNRNDTFGALVIRMKDFATELLQARNIDLEFVMIGVDEGKVLDPALKQNIYLIFKESIHNVVKHSQARKVVVTISNKESEFKMEIKDDGHGFDHKNLNGGNGLRNMKRRAKAVDASFEVLNQQGTTVTLARKSL